MPDEFTPPPETPPANPFGRRAGKGLADDTTRNLGSSILPDANPRPLEVIGDFEIIAKLGQGGMGTVYRALQVSLNRQVALKILPSYFEADPDYVTRFQREARVAASLRHANLVQVYSSGQADGCHYIAMELIEGETLGQWVKRGALPPLEALRIILDVAHALECGWGAAQLIHRDIKPGNIFLSINGEVKLGDLGLAKIVGAETTGLTQTGAAMGTPHYISPEQARGDRDLDFRADIYSLGCTLYQMLTRQTPYSGHEPMVVMNQHINAPPPAILKVMPQCPLPLARLVSKMLKKQRRERHTSYEELIAAIESVRVALDPALAAPALLAPSRPDPITPSAALETAVQDVSIPARRGGVSRPAPKKTALYGSGGVLVLIVAAFFLWPKGEKLTKAQIYAHDHATEIKAAADAEAALAGATKDAPFVNTLGMKFVPVPILGGPTGGKTVLFSVWDTRVQDYEVFVKETKREWPKPDFEQRPTHPAVNVSWEDAQAFCAWLTERERKAGKLGANEVYRLPSDHEWSCAVGIGEREDAAKLPTEKNGKISDAFPWGTQWPPPKGAGNYAGEELQPAFAAGKFSYVKGVIAGYNDGFVNTSPVGSFAANRSGLYDMGGNVQQWCEDWFDKDQKDRVLRGVSWPYYDRGTLLSSYRIRGVPGGRFNGNGFRCVLARDSFAPSTEAAAGNREAGGRTGSAALEPGAIKLWVFPEKIPKQEGVSWENGALRLDKSGPVYTESTSRDAVIRASIRMNPDYPANQVPQLDLRYRRTQPGGDFYCVGVSAKESYVQLTTVYAGKYTKLQSWPLPRAYGPDEWIRLELRAIGDELTVIADGQTLGTVHDTSQPEAGGVRVYAANGYFRDIVYVPLDNAPNGSASTPATATKEVPFVNTLGMKFVPVPGTQVLFSVWDTRVQDYSAYAGAKKADDSWTKQEKAGVPAGRELNHPVVGVSWEDAQGFCQWLTEKETAEGKLPKGLKYRLPTDEEWSWAVGLPSELGATPAEKSLKNSVEFPWGKEYPPRGKVGNYADEAFHAKFPPKEDAKDDWNKNRWIEGYTDGYATTSPVGSFPANAYGFYDMGGNVWQWCEDWFDASHKDRVLRGASWNYYDRFSLLSSIRNQNVPGYRSGSVGFRCVVGVSAR
jgi:formylglycine-generating enzyme required for sulfatase activity/serine/threonine protein kinase